MSKSNQIASGLVMLLIMAVALFFWYRTAVPTNAEVDAQTPVVIPIDSNIFNGSAAQSISQRDTNGNLPLVVGPDEVGRDNPFSDY